MPTQDWVMDPNDCEFENLFDRDLMADPCIHFKGYKIAKLYFEYDQRCTELKMRLYEAIDQILEHPCPGEENRQEKS